MDTYTALIAITLVVGLLVIAIEWITRGDRRDWRDTWGEPPLAEFVADADMRPAAVQGRPRVQDPVVAQVFERADLLDVHHLQGMDLIDALLIELLNAVVAERERPRRRPRPPTSVLLCGPPGVGMTVLAHAFARRFDARLVQIYASAVIPITNGGSQPVIGPAVNQARDRQPSVLFVDEFETLAGHGVVDVRCQRAANDLLNECLSPVYGSAPVVIAAFTVHDARRLPRRVARAFEHVVWIDVPELERAVVREIIRTSDHELFRVMPAGRVAERADVRHPPPSDVAAA